MTRGVAERLAGEALAGAGLSAELVTAHAARRALERRLKALGLEVAGYESRYAAEAGERGAYLDGLLTGETSFFRDASVYAEMRRWCLGWLASHAEALRILSAPCSTGEEPYSLAAMLLEAGVERERFTIDAMDLSAAALDHARAGEYAGMALRNVAAPAESWFLERVKAGFRVRDEVRRCVGFKQANLVEEDALCGAKYGLICCRNLMIYQTPEARARTAAVLAGALEEGGRVVLGSADWCRELGELFVLEQPMQSFALRAKTVAVRESPHDHRDEAAVIMGHPVEVAQAPRESTDEVALELSGLYRRALEAYVGGEEARAERLCRQALYVDGDHVETLALMAKLARPHVPARHRMALAARLERLQGDAA